MSLDPKITSSSISGIVVAGITSRALHSSLRTLPIVVCWNLFQTFGRPIISQCLVAVRLHSWNTKARRAHIMHGLFNVKNTMHPFPTFDVERPPKQYTITALVHKKLARDLPEVSNRMKIMRNSMKLPEAKTWTQCRPSETLKTSIPRHLFRLWLQYFCHVPRFQPSSRCARP